MKRLLSLSITFFVLGLGTSNVAYASLCPTGGGVDYSPLCGIQVGGLAGPIITVIILLAFFGSLFFLILGGIRWIMSSGDRGKVEQARSTIIAAIVGMIIALLSYFIVNLLVQYFTHTTINGGFNIPRLVP